MAPYGVIGTLFARGTVNAAVLIALVESGVFAELPDLRVVVTGHAVGGLAMASGLSRQSRQPTGATEVMRRHVFIDTQMVHPALIRAAVDLLGAGHVMAGSDWPIVDDGPVCGRCSTRWRRQACRRTSRTPSRPETVCASSASRKAGPRRSSHGREPREPRRSRVRAPGRVQTSSPDGMMRRLRRQREG
jgi:hypothetical protein